MRTIEQMVAEARAAGLSALADEAEKLMNSTREQISSLTAENEALKAQVAALTPPEVP